MARRLLCILVIALFLLPNINGFVFERREREITRICPKDIIHFFIEKLIHSFIRKCNDVVDQSQEKHDDYYKYDSHEKVFYQSFVPRIAKITKIELYLGRKRLFDSSVTSLSHVSVGKNSSPAGITDIQVKIAVAILEDKPSSEGDGYRAVMKSDWVRISDVPKNGGWVEFHFKYADHYLIIPGKTYYLCIFTWGQISPMIYFKWYYGYNNPYPDGSAGGSGVDSNVDFCFRTYGIEDDGVVNRYAVLVGVGITKDGRECSYADWSPRRIREALLMDENWDAGNIKVFINESATKENVLSAVKKFVLEMDGDDILLIAMNGHAGTWDLGEISLYDGVLKAKELDEILDKWNVNAVIAIDCCFSGSWIDPIKGDRRVVLTSVAANEYASTGGDDWGASPYFSLFCEALSGHFVRKIVDYNESGGMVVDKEWKRGDKIPEDMKFYPDFNRDGYVSAEEVHEYVVFWYKYEHYKEHPQISDGYPYLYDNDDEFLLTRLS